MAQQFNCASDSKRLPASSREHKERYCGADGGGVTGRSQWL